MRVQCRGHHRSRQALVVYNPVFDQVFAQGLDKPVAGGAERLGAMSYAALQQPGPAADSVALETTTELKVIGLGAKPGQGGVRLPSQIGPGAERPKVSRPVRLGDCVHAASAQTSKAYYGVNCGQAETVTAGTLDKPGDAPLRDGMALRTNRGLIVLNDLDSGNAWDLDSKPLKIDNWDSVIPPSKADDKSDNKDKNVVDDTTTPQPPKAEPDNLKVRPRSHLQAARPRQRHRHPRVDPRDRAERGDPADRSRRHRHRGR